jgi:hypothetical protein
MQCCLYRKKSDAFSYGVKQRSVLLYVVLEVRHTHAHGMEALGNKLRSLDKDSEEYKNKVQSLWKNIKVGDSPPINNNRCNIIKLY